MMIVDFDKGQMVLEVQRQVEAFIASQLRRPENKDTTPSQWKKEAWKAIATIFEPSETVGSK